MIQHLALALAALAIPSLASAQALPQPRYGTPAANDNSNRLATTEYVDQALRGAIAPTFVQTRATGTSCSAGDGHRATDGTQSWEPTCFGVFSTSGQTIPVNPTRGTPTDGNDKSVSIMHTPFLIQAQAKGDVPNEQHGGFINLDVVGGAESKAHLNTTNTTGLLISLRSRPGPNGERPPTTWALNTDFHIAPGSGSVASFGYELDMNNFNKPCLPGSDCNVSHLFINGIQAHTGTTFWLANAGATSERGGTVTTSGTTITRVSGPAYTPELFRVNIEGQYYRVLYKDPDHLSVTDSPPPTHSSPVAMATKNAMVYDGMIFGGDWQTQNSDLALATSAYSSVLIAGKHHVGINTAGDSAPYALIAKAGQNLCLNSFGGCLAYDAGSSLLRYNGGIGFHDNGFVEASGVLVTQGTGFRRPAYTPSSSSAACTAGDEAADSLYVYRCVATNTWKRAALSSW